MPILGSIIKRALELRGKKPIESIRKPDGLKTQKRTLKKLLKKAQFTAFGEHYEFDELLRQDDVIKAFKEKVPIYEYNSIFRKWWYRALNGEAFVTWPGRVKYFALSSGTSDSTSKHIPVTGDMIRAIRRTSVKQLVSLSNYSFPKEFYQKGMLMLGGSTHLN